MLFSVLCASSLIAQQEIEGVIAGGTLQPIVVAFPKILIETDDAEGKTESIAKNIAAVVQDDLASTGLLYLLPNDKIFLRFNNFNDGVNFASWRELSTEVLLKASLKKNAKGTLELRFRIFDVVAGTEFGEGTMLSGLEREWRRMAHKISDAIYTNITGEGAYFDSRIVFVAEKGIEQKTQFVAISDSDGANIHYLTSGKFPVFSPQFSSNNRDVIYTSLEDGEPKILLFDAETGKSSDVLNMRGISFAPEISADGSFALVSRTNEKGNTDILRVDWVILSGEN